jgi:iron-sulfur cluster repair protein YtfE (RIC family)
MTDAGDKAPATGLEEQILAEHRTIRELGQRIENSRSLVELLELLKEFRALLELHFMNEEAPEGFFDAMRNTGSRPLTKVDQLEKEHWALLADLDRVSESARVCLAGPVAAVLTEARALTRRVRTHEAAENALLLDTVYTDLGQGG